MKGILRFLFLAVALLFSGGARSSGPGFTWVEDPHGVWLHENGNPVYYYRRMPKQANDTVFCNNYLHPLYLPGGTVLTEEFPADHPYHRGVFWAWHQMHVNGQRLGDGWILQTVSQQVTRVRQHADSVATLELSVDWVSPVWQHGAPFIREYTTLIAHPMRNGLRMIDAEIRLTALTGGVTLGGSEDEKGYGGFCIRMRLPADLTFTAETGQVTPQTLQIQAGPWMDITGAMGLQGEQGGVAVLCHPSNPLYPAPWILRKETSMQNSVYPGQFPVPISEEYPVVLRYRMVLHDGKPDTSRLEAWQAAFSRYSFPEKQH